ncbi:MAG TPA: efflux RND transporter periplasmic adaptor subunit [Candidatus Binataceae bacterium]|nr:efflux RND transporter periplasmic adaptor subunit [Candidatus Binataceae bacterium]
MKITFVKLMAISALLTLCAAGCNREVSTNTTASAANPPFVPQLVQEGSHEYLLVKQGDVPGMTFVEVKQVPLPGVLETTGQFNFDDKKVSTIVSRVQGRIEDIRASLWDTVTRGEPIAKLYSPDFMTAEAEYLQAIKTTRVTRGAAIEGTVDMAASMAVAAKRKLLLLGMEERDIDAIREPTPSIWMRAPISGIVVKNQAVRGTAINPGDQLYQLGTLDPIWVQADLYEMDLARVHDGQELEANTPAFPNEVFRGTIARISPNVDPNSHTLQIRCAIPNHDLRLKPQMMADIKIITSVGNAVVVPLDALVFDDDRYYVYVDIGNGRIDRRAVAIGAWSEEGIARVISGLKPGDRVVDQESLQVNALWHQAHGESS